MMNSLRARRLLLALLLTCTAFAAAFVLTRSAGTETPPAATARHRLPPVLAALDTAPRADPAIPAAPPPPTQAQVRSAIASAIAAQGFGGRLLARVADAETGAVLYDEQGSTPAAPASAAKLLTAAAILAVHEPSDRFATIVVDGGNGTIVLVGGGDPTLSAAARREPPVYPGAARLADLAAQITRARVVVKRIVVDGALFSGPSISPDWDRTDIGTSYGSAITAAMTDGGRADPSAIARSTIPDLSAGAELAAALGNANLPVSRGVAPAGAKRLARVDSAPLSELITEMLQTSDNTIADVLARQVAVAEHVRASFRGATAAIRTVLARLGVQIGAGMKDGSGLSSADRVSPAALVGVLRLVVRAGPPAGAQVRFIASALPVGGWSGTLINRFAAGGGAVLAGQVRAKTGTLSGVSSLAGFVHDRSGRLLVFCLDADRAIGTDAAEAALDAIVIALSSVTG